MWKGREPKLETERLLLRPFWKRDVADLPLVDADPDVTYFRGISPKTAEESEQWLVEQLRSRKKKEWLRWCIRRKDDNAFVGMVLVRCLNPDWREWEVGYCLAKSQWGQGFASEAVREILGFAYASLNAHRVVANTHVENGRSRKLLEGIGFRQEAYQVENYFEHGEWLDNIQYALLDREFSSVQGSKKS